MEELLEPGSGPRLPLGTAEVHVWCVTSQAVRERALLHACAALLSPEEHARLARFRSPAMRHEYLVAHALLRTVLSRHVDVDPGAWVFAPTAHGRPEVAGPPGLPPVRFNLSHTDGLIACAIALERPIGVDVENVTRRDAVLPIAERFFSPPEAAVLRTLEGDAQRRRFYAYWTLKESYVKARGLGLSLPLDGFAFLLDDPHAIGVRFASTVPDDARRWQFALRAPTPEHLMAVSIGRDAAGTFPTLRLHRIVSAGCGHVRRPGMPSVAGEATDDRPPPPPASCDAGTRFAPSSE